MKKRLPRFAFVLLALWAAWPATAQEPASQPAARPLFDADKYLAHVKYLASDELEGRLTGTPGCDLAAEYIARQFAEAGLKPAGDDGSWFQHFAVTRGKQLVDDDALLEVDGLDHKWQVRKDWIPLPFTSLEDVDGPLAFAGYGIKAEAHDYDDYAALDATGKILLMFRYEPPADDPNADFGGQTPSRHSMFIRKAELAAKQGAKAVLIVNPPKRAGLDDKLYAFDEFFTDQTYELPIVHVTRELAEVLVKKAGLGKLASVQDQLDRERKPLSADMNLTLHLKTGVKSHQVDAKNVLGLLKGTGGTDETIVLGAHYDHLGNVPAHGGRAGDLTRQIHNGADDNASGTAGVIELARALGQERGLRRNILLITFSGEELGLLGSEHFVTHPTLALKNIRAMVNFDMIGRLNQHKFTIYGVGSGKEFVELLRQAAEQAGVEYRALSGGGGMFGASDHSSFYSHDIPVLFPFTGVHKQYHQPEDDWELIDAAGATRVLTMFHETVRALASLETGPTFVTLPKGGEEEEEEEPPIKPAAEHAKEAQADAAKPEKSHTGGEIGRRGRPQVRLGIAPEYSATSQPGVVAATVADGGAAKAAGMLEGDRIIRIGEHPIKDMYGYMEAMREAEPGQTLEVVVVRKDEEVTLKVKLKEATKPRGQE
jgi:hypothetical protein